MPEYNTDYLKFDAISIKNAIKQRLTEDSNFTDHLFEGSNLTTIIDIFSHLFEVLMYYNNHGASEALFTDAQYYENLNRIVKLLGYNPLGGLSSTVTMQFHDATATPTSGTIFSDSSVQKQIPKYGYVDTGLSDSNGRTIYYSLLDPLYVSKRNPSTDAKTFSMTNGRWKLYPQTFVAAGIPFEEFVMSDLQVANTSDPVHIAHPHIEIYIKSADVVEGEYSYEEYFTVTESNLFTYEDSILGGDTKACELRINEDGYYTIKFGDNVRGRQLVSGEEIYIIYLEGNGKDGKIGINTINSVGGVQWDVAGLDTNVLKKLLGIDEELFSYILSDTEINKLRFQNVSESTLYETPETVESIRTNAPSAIKAGTRLITADDFAAFMKHQYGSNLFDVYVMNNWQYLSEFYKWLYDYGSLNPGLQALGYEYVDSCDFNNVYIWCKYKGDIINEAVVYEAMQTRKCLTAEPKLQTALDVNFVPCLNFNTSDSQPVGYTNLKYDIDNWDPNYENWLEIIKDPNVNVSSSRLKTEAVSLIYDFFDPLLNMMGQQVDLGTLYTSLISITGVKDVRTAYLANGDSNTNTQYFNGISFAMWTETLISGKDVDTLRGTVTLKKFQFPVLYTFSLENRIKIVSESFGVPFIEY
jgi:hypothetical protein